MRYLNQVSVDIILGAIILLLLIAMVLNHRLKADSGKTDRASGGLGVKELIQKVKSELIATEIERRSSNEAALFEIKDFDLEIKFTVNTSRTVSGKIDYKVVVVGGDKKLSSEEVQTIKLHMVTLPTGLDGRDKASQLPLKTEAREVISEPEPEGR
ncbi:MAG: hypothetical protein AMJ94_06240 [Deltaproteobacteria bacterium SM23_61]|nr:MAG: hypothetical protein AMJ94_06240 [Deltaproteobacteria bacterium SM23_61]